MAPRIQTARLVLDELRDDDAKPLNAIRNDAAVRRYLAPKPRESLDTTRELIETIRSDNEAGRALNFALRRIDEDDLIGFAGVWRIDVAARRGEVGYLISARCWNRGFATEALAAVIEYVDEHLPRVVLEAVVHRDNAPSIRVLHRFGFRPLGDAGEDEPGCDRYERAPRI